MEIVNIYPIANQSMYAKEDYVMILAHLVKQNYYKPENFYKIQHIIMDNGLFEGAQVSTDLADLILLAETSGIPVKEIVIPDVANDLKGTIKLFKKNLKTIKQWEHKYQFMFVAQATTYEELEAGIRFINHYKKLNLSVAISKLTPLDRSNKEAMRCYLKSELPIHFLGLKDTFRELLPIHSLIRSCDTSQLAYIVKNSASISNIDIIQYTRNASTTLICENPIDLEHDKCNAQKLQALRTRLWRSYGIL